MKVAALAEDSLDDDRERLERRMYLNGLYDLYSPLLTARQRDVYEMLNFSDLGPTEAARSLGVTRQAVHILERRVAERLDSIEEELHFAETTRQLESRIRRLERRLALEEGNRDRNRGHSPGRRRVSADAGRR